MKTAQIQLKNGFKSYPEYKDSGIPWIGEISREWISRRGKFLFKSEKRVNRGMKYNNILSLTMHGVVSRSELGEGGLLPSDYSTFQIFEKDDLVFKLIDLENYKTSRVGLVHEQGIMSSAYIRVFPNADQNLFVRYFFYFYYNLYLEGIYNFLGMGVRSTMNDADLLGMSVIIPPLETQKRIAEYLDEKTVLIDKIIEKKKRLIELLREKRTTVINQAVTKGLDLSVASVDSGIEWIGKIPKGWEIRKMKYVARVQASNVDKLTDPTLPSVLLCNYVDVYKNEYIDSALKFMPSTATYEQIKKVELRKNDVLLTKDSETANDIGIPAVVKENIKGLVSGYHLYVARPTEKSMNGNFLFRYLQSQFVRSYFETSANGVTRFGLGSMAVKDTPVLVPDLDEQRKISEYVNEKAELADLIIQRVKNSIETLKEFKSSLISNVVTGKVKI